MKRRLRLSGRKKLDRSNVKIEMLEADPGGDCSFDVAFDFSRIDLPDQAKVIVEPFVRQTSMRFEFGTVGSIVPPVDNRLTQLDMGGNVQFRVKILDPDGSGKILASADKMRPVLPGQARDRRSMISLETANIGNEPWRLNVDDDNGPVLVVNNSIPDAKQRLIADPVFSGLVLPAALKMILNCIKPTDYLDEDPSECWQSQWLQFGKNLSGADVYVEEYTGWVDDVVNSFCDKYQVCPNLVEEITEGV